jgi:AraC-like DNA-binding protein
MSAVAPFAGRGRIGGEASEGHAWRRLFTSPTLHLSTYHFAGERDETPWSHTILLPGSGGCWFESEGRKAVADANTVLFLNADVPYRVTPLHPAGATGHAIALRPDILFRSLRTAADPLRPFDRLAAGCATDAYFTKHVLLDRGLGSDPEAMSEFESGALSLALKCLPPKERAETSLRRSEAAVSLHRETAEKVKAFLAERVCDPVQLAHVADAVKVSPFHLCRIFKAESGLSIHRYLNRLRLREALGRVSAPRADLMDIALDLGFSSHSHFSFAFGREYGVSPTRFRRLVSARTLKDALADLARIASRRAPEPDEPLESAEAPSSSGG